MNLSLFGPVKRLTEAEMEKMKKEIIVSVCSIIANALDVLGGDNIDEEDMPQLRE